jgi:hypothetical protein
VLDVMLHGGLGTESGLSRRVKAFRAARASPPALRTRRAAQRARVEAEGGAARGPRAERTKEDERAIIERRTMSE